MENTVNEQFKIVISTLIEQKKAKSKKEIADNLGMSPSYFSELLKDRINLSADHIQKICNNYNIDPRFIFGKSPFIFDNTPHYKIDEQYVSMVLEDYTPYAKTPNVSPKPSKNVSPTVSPTHENCRICDEKERIISSMEITIEALQEANIQLKKRLIDQDKDNRQAG